MSFLQCISTNDRHGIINGHFVRLTEDFSHTPMKETNGICVRCGSRIVGYMNDNNEEILLEIEDGKITNRSVDGK